MYFLYFYIIGELKSFIYRYNETPYKKLKDMIMTFEYKNDIELDKLKKSSTISVLCNHCGLVKENCSVKNYISITSKIRKMNDKEEITALYLCRKCSKKLQDTNKSIVN